MTLDDLKAQFRALQVKRLGEARASLRVSERVIESWADDSNHDQKWDDGEDAKLCNKMVEVARQYVIARDEGMGAAVLYKLSLND